MIKAVIFDLDGTLLYTLDSIALSVNKVLAAHAVPAVDNEQLKRFVGDGVIDLLRRAFKAGGSVQTPDKTTVAEFRACFKDDCDYHVKAYDGIPEVIDFLKNKKIKIACNSNKPDVNAKIVIEKHFADTFDMVVGQREDLPKKPDPSGAKMFLNAFDILPSETVYIGDSDVDILTAKHLGCTAIGAAWGYRGAQELRESGADYIAEKPADVLEYLNSCLSV